MLAEGSSEILRVCKQKSMNIIQHSYSRQFVLPFSCSANICIICG